MHRPAPLRPQRASSGLRARVEGRELDAAALGASREIEAVRENVAEPAATQAEADTAPVANWLLELFNAPDYRPPVLPSVALQLLTLSTNSDVRLSEVARLLEQDPMLTAVMLRIANSAVHRAGRGVATIDDAITRLGLRRVTELVLEAAVHTRVFQARGYEDAMEQLRAHSSATAHVARMLSRFGGVDPSEAFVCGLLHDVGVAAALIAVSEHFDASEQPLLEVIWPAVVAHHAASGALLQQCWGLPRDLGYILGHHHVPHEAASAEPGAQRSGLQHSEAQHALLAVVALADALVSELGAGLLDETPSHAVKFAQDALGIEQGLLDRARGNARTFIERLHK